MRQRSTSKSSAAEVLLTVAWELSWYQFGVDLSDGREPVRSRGQGQELAELPEEAQDWNCTVDENGRIELETAPPRSSEARSRGSETVAATPIAVASPGNGPYSDFGGPRSHGTRQERASRANCEDSMIYCVIPAALADELYDKLTEYYKDDPGVEVIIDRRKTRAARARQHRRRQARDPRPAPPARPGIFPRLELD